VRYRYTATLLPNGQLLAAGGEDGSYADLASAELYDPATGNWTATGSLTTSRSNHRATLLPDGRVLVSGGDSRATGDSISSTEIYDPASGVWTETSDLATGRGSHSSTLLPGGRVLVAGGESAGAGFLASAELYNAGLDFNTDWQPVINTAAVSPRYRLRLTGSRFQGISQASGGGYQDSSTNYPVVQLRALGNEQVTFLLADPLRSWSDSAFFSLPARGFVPGPALMTVFTNGIPSESKYLVVPQ